LDGGLPLKIVVPPGSKGDWKVNITKRDTAKGKGRAISKKPEKDKSRKLKLTDEERSAMKALNENGSPGEKVRK